MKKQFIKVKDFANLAKIKKQINDTLTGDKSQELKTALTDLINELDTSEVEIDETAFAEKVAELIKGYMSDPNAEVPASVANAIATKIKAVQDSMKKDGSEKLSVEVKNKITKSLVFGNYPDRNAVKNAVDKILVENGVTGLEFTQSVDYVVANKWEDLNPLFSKLKKTFISKFFYTTDEMNNVNVIAKQWDKNGGVEKTIQALTTTPKEISTAYGYVRQNMSQEDLDDISEAGQESAFLSWINSELDLHLVNTIVMAILVGDTINVAGKRFNKFETIGTKTATDAFTIVQNPATALTVTVTDIRTMVDKLYNPQAKSKLLVIDQTLLTALSAYVYAAGGDTHYRSIDEMKGQFGVDEIYISNILSNLAGVHCIAMIPDGYWYKEKKSISVSWPIYEKNELSFMKERNIGGKIHDLLSTAVLKEA